MAAWLKHVRMLWLNADLALAQLRSDPRFVCLTAFGVVIGTAVLAATMGMASIAEQRLALIKEEIGTQVIYLTVASPNASDFRRKHGRLLDPQELAALAQATGTFALQATFLSGITPVEDLAALSATRVLGFADGDLPRLDIAFASGLMQAPDACYLDAASVPLTTPRSVRVGTWQCELSGTFWRRGLLASLLNGESNAVLLTSFNNAYAALSTNEVMPSLVMVFRLHRDEGAFSVLAVLGEFLQRSYPDVQFSLEWPGTRLVPLNNLLNQVRLVAVLIGALIMLISAVAMANAMLAQIGQRRREFGVRLAIGATAHDLIQQTLFEVLGIFGGGLLAGYGVAVLVIYFWCLFSGWVFSLAPSLFFLSGGVTFICAICSALYPALTAARIEPIEAMQQS